MKPKKSKKKILLYPPYEKWHSVYNPTIKLLSKEYELIYSPKEAVSTGKFSKVLRSPLVKYLYYRLFRPYFSLREFKSRIKRPQKTIINCDLIFASNCIPPGQSPYILDLENITALGGYDYNRLDINNIRIALEDPRCKQIICWNEICKSSLINTINCSKLLNKITVIPFSIKSDKIPIKPTKETLNLLFVSSVNNVHDFELKGGIITLKVFEYLSKKYQNIHLTIRAHVPQWVKKKYGHFKRINLIEGFLPDEKMKELFLNSDILLEPVPGINLLLESMNYAISTISFNFWMIPEMVIDGYSGLLVDSKSFLGDPSNMKDYLINLNLRWMRLYSKKINPKIVEEFIDKAELLIKDKNLRKTMEKNAKGLISPQGKYYFDSRNKKILRIFNQILN